MRPYKVTAVESASDWKWRIQITAGNGQIIAKGSVAYSTRFAAERAANALLAATLVSSESRPLRKRRV